MKNAVKIAFVIIGSLVGAGFASGKEIFSFFFIYGKIGVLGMFIACAIISFVIFKVFEICNENEIDNYEQFCNVLKNSNNNRLFYVFKNDNNSKLKLYKNDKYNFSNVLNSIVNIFLLITFFVMIAGFSSFLKQEFNINKIIGSLIIIIMCYFIFLRNINGLIKISNYLIPILIVFIICISVKNLNFVENYNNIFGLETAAAGALWRKSIFHGMVRSVLYACYNCVVLIPVLIPLRTKLKNSKIVFFTSVITGGLLLVLSFSIYNILLQGNSEIYALDMPIIGVVKSFGKFYKIMYVFIIIISILTSAISAGFGFLNNCSKNEKDFKRNLVLISVLAIVLSQVGFSTLVELLYPVLGVFGSFEILIVIFQ